MLLLLRALLAPKLHLALENIALRQQVAVLRRWALFSRIHLAARFSDTTGERPVAQ